jgi:hypothetical protein
MITKNHSNAEMITRERRERPLRSSVVAEKQWMHVPFSLLLSRSRGRKIPSLPYATSSGEENTTVSVVIYPSKEQAVDGPRKTRGDPGKHPEIRSGPLSFGISRPFNCKEIRDKGREVLLITVTNVVLDAHS